MTDDNKFKYSVKIVCRDDGEETGNSNVQFDSDDFIDAISYALKATSPHLAGTVLEQIAMMITRNCSDIPRDSSFSDAEHEFALAARRLLDEFCEIRKPSTPPSPLPPS